MKVYLLTHGDYSDKVVTAVFTDQEEAMRVAELTAGNVSEPFELNGFNVKEPPAGMKFWRITMLIDGEVWCSEDSVLAQDGSRWETSWCMWDASSDKMHPRLGARLYAESEAHAIKIVNEWRGQIMAGVRPEAGIEGRG
jgi:hypothetical protein